MGWGFLTPLLSIDVSNQARKDIRECGDGQGGDVKWTLKTVGQAQGSEVLHVSLGQEAEGESEWTLVSKESWQCGSTKDFGLFPKEKNKNITGKI